MAEVFDLLDKNRIPTGEKILRGSHFSEGQYHQVVHICIFNQAGQMLIQQRQPFKEGWPGFWDITLGGSVIEGEDACAGAHRELMEELGIDYDFTDVRPQLTVNFEHGFDDYFILAMELDPAGLRFQPEEVQAARWAEREEIHEMIDRGVFIPYWHELIDLLFASRFHWGAHQPHN